jgi:hypothetical protein
VTPKFDSVDKPARKSWRAESKAVDYIDIKAMQEIVRLRQLPRTGVL